MAQATRSPHTWKAPKPKRYTNSPVSVIGDLLQVDPLELRSGNGLLPLLDPNLGTVLLDNIGAIRRQVAVELGIVMPGVRFRNLNALAPNAYLILVRDVEVESGQIEMGRLLATGSEEKLAQLGGLASTTPQGVWVSDEARSQAEELGCSLLDPATVLANQLYEVVRQKAPALLGLQEAEALLAPLRKTHPVVVRSAVPERLSLVDLWQVLRALLRLQVSIRDLVSILEALATLPGPTQDVFAATEHVRKVLARGL